ncbi:MAG: NAD kinase [Prevotellaceae bacterium]|jgi:NAD+ kinase|nr:NAD kinase [Prevotellaceae bacterium]
MKIIIFGNCKDAFVEKIINILAKNNVEVVSQLDDKEISADMAISLGGDGTFLNTASKIGNKNIPILGINAGRLGFLADVSKNEIETVLQDILDKKYRIEERTVLQLSLSGTGGKPAPAIPVSPFALNEIAVLKLDTSAMLNISAWVNNEFINTYKSDGLLVATPTGSTAYALSVGGAILAPNSQNFIVLPVASHSLTVRPLVISDSCEIALKIASRTGYCQIAIDGRSFQISDKTEILIKKADYTIKSIQPESHSFFNTLRNKLMWGADARTD